uniref:RES domain-containing protein n=1 Tax=Angiostrongylus cantonensis TaxID=6313 RepID=A0A0K0DIL6_ANGCA
MASTDYLKVFLQIRRNEMRQMETGGRKAQSTGHGIMDVTISSCTPCPYCRTMIYDEEIMSGWKVVITVDDQSLITNCPHCYVPDEETNLGAERKGVFAPRLTVHMEWKEKPVMSWYRPNIFDVDPEISSDVPTEATQDLCLSFVSPLVLRREVETLLAADMYALKFTSSEKVSRYLPVWRAVTQSVQENKLFTAIQALINDSRRVTDSGQITLGQHFPVFRDIQFASLDAFGRSLLRDNLDKQYIEEYSRLPPRIMCILPRQDKPPNAVQRACRKVFLPLDLF